MTTSSDQISAGVLALAISGAVLLVAGTALGVRARRSSRRFAWIAIATLAYPLLAGAAALHVPATDGVRAAALQLLATVLAAALGLTVGARPGEGESPPRSPLSAAGRALAWLTLVGLPPTIGFHGRILVYRALLGGGWEALTVLALAGGAAALFPALRAIRSPHPAAVGGLRAVLAVALMAGVLALGLYPGGGMALAQIAENLAAAR
jgi:NADH-quinone oxidoreductase subunit N